MGSWLLDALRSLKEMLQGEPSKTASHTPAASFPDLTEAIPGFTRAFLKLVRESNANQRINYHLDRKIDLRVLQTITIIARAYNHLAEDNKEMTDDLFEHHFRIIIPELAKYQHVQTISGARVCIQLLIEHLTRFAIAVKKEFGKDEGIGKAVNDFDYVFGFLRADEIKRAAA